MFLSLVQAEEPRARLYGTHLELRLSQGFLPQFPGIYLTRPALSHLAALMEPDLSQGSCHSSMLYCTVEASFTSFPVFTLLGPALQ